ncbi:MAG: carboxy terminal-processing peptidase [Kofleriaceae bacterium]
MPATASVARVARAARGKFIACAALVVASSAAVVATSFGSPAAPPGRADAPTTEANITRLTTSLLEHSQLGHHPLDAELAGKILDRYTDALDGNRSLFVQADVDEFATLRFALAETTRLAGDTRAAHSIFAVYLERLGQQADYIDRTLASSTFDFTGHDVYRFDRAHAARPADLAAAQALWRQQLRAEYLQLELAGKPRAQIVAMLTRRHHQQLKIMKELTSDEVLAVYLDAIAHVYDPHSDYLGHEQMQSFAIAMNLSLFGIGASLESHDGACLVREVIPGGPAARTGLLQPGDRIVAVAQSGHDPVDILNMPLTRAVELIRGPKGSRVTLSIVPAGALDGSVPKTISLVRDKINLADQEAKARIVDLPTSHGGVMRLGVIDLPGFYADPSPGAAHRSATADVARLLAKLEAEHVRGIILDLRRNGGGSLAEAIDMTGLFIGHGPVVETRGPTGAIEVGQADAPTIAYDGPLLVLTSRFSASASEILAGALQDYGRAVVVGDTTSFGKGTVQTVIPLARLMDQNGLAYGYDPGELKVSISKFYRPDGASTQLRGVRSDLVLPSLTDVADIGEATLADPLPWDAIAAVPHARSNQVERDLAVLRAKSAARVAASRDFTELADEARRVKAVLATKSVSLNEVVRRDELARDKAREAAHARAAVTHADRTTSYAITLEHLASPGLPAADPGIVPAPVRPFDDGDDASAASAIAESARADQTVLREALDILADDVDLSATETRSAAR